MPFGLDALAVAVALLLSRSPLWKAEAELSVEIRADELKAHVYRLASREFLGRRGPGAARAANHLAAAFERLGLRPAFGTSYSQPIPWLLGRKEGFAGRNVGAVLPGSDPELRDEWILLSAHYDHLGGDGDHYYPGADDNASGVAMLLEVAEHFALRPDRPRRTVLFVAFDGEETGLLGSTHFAAHPPRPLRQLRACLTADMIGRSMANVMDEYVFALGSETAPQLRELIETVKPPEGLKVGRLGADIIGTRSDYGPFRDRRVPFLFFSTGQHPDYHSPRDLPDRLDYEKLRRISVWIAALTERLANDDAGPVWDTNPPRADLEEVRTVQRLVTRVLDRPRDYPLNRAQREILRGVQERLAGIVERGTVTAGERTWLVWSARLLLATVF
jgi:Zn-dependent M28 family amino/carboxypeptidase